MMDKIKVLFVKPFHMNVRHNREEKTIATHVDFSSSVKRKTTTQVASEMAYDLSR